MELTTLLFLGFFAAVALLNYTLPRVLRPYCLLAASYLFYCWGANDRLLVPVLVAATLVTWGCGLVIGQMPDRSRAGDFPAFGGVHLCGAFVYYKYWNLLAADILSGTVLQPR
ncbi:cellulose acetylase, subunit WssH, partial [human gut metagenome]